MDQDVRKCLFGDPSMKCSIWKWSKSMVISTLGEEGEWRVDRGIACRIRAITLCILSSRCRTIRVLNRHITRRVNGDMWISLRSISLSQPLNTLLSRTIRLRQLLMGFLRVLCGLRRSNILGHRDIVNLSYQNLHIQHLRTIEDTRDQHHPLHPTIDLARLLRMVNVPSASLHHPHAHPPNVNPLRGRIPAQLALEAHNRHQTVPRLRLLAS